MALILTGGGSGNDTLKIDKLFSEMLDKTKPLLYIPIAIDSIKHPYPECLTWLKNTFDKFGIKNYKLCSEENLVEISQEKPEKFSGIYIGGGNTFYLMKKLKETGLWVFLKEAIKKDIPIYGGSAGAIIFSKDIKTSLNFDKNWVELTDFSGMNLIRDYSLWCHFNLDKEQKIKKIIKEQKITHSIALTEKNALLLSKNTIQVIGNEPAYIFDASGTKKEALLGLNILD